MTFFEFQSLNQAQVDETNFEASTIVEAGAIYYAAGSLSAWIWAKYIAKGSQVTMQSLMPTVYCFEGESVTNPCVL